MPSASASEVLPEREFEFKLFMWTSLSCKFHGRKCQK